MRVLDGGALAAGGGLRDRGLDQLRRPRPPGRAGPASTSAPYGATRVPVASVTASASATSSRGAREVAAERGGLAEHVDADGEHLERAGVAGELDPACRRSRGRCRSPTAIDRRRRGQPAPAQHLLDRDVGARRTRWRRACSSGVAAGAPVGEDQREAVEQQSDGAGRGAGSGAVRTARETSSRLPAVGQAPGEQRRAPRVEVGVAREADVERLEPSSRPGAAAAGRRCRGSGRTRPRRAAGRRGRARARRAARPPRPPAARAPCRTRRPAGWPGRRPAPARPAAPGRASARPRAAGTRPRRRARRGPAPGRPSARARTRPPRRARRRRRRDARRGGPGRPRRRSPPPARRCDGAALLRRRRPVDRRAHQRVAEGHPLADRQQPVGLVRRRGARCRAARAARHRSSGSPTGSAAATSSSSRASSGSASSRRRKLSSIRPGSASASSSPKPARQLRRGQPARQLEQRQRVAARLGDDPVADPLVEPGRG